MDSGFLCREASCYVWESLKKRNFYAVDYQSSRVSVDPEVVKIEKMEGL